MPTWLGIDIGSATVKVAVLRTTYRKTAVVALASAEVEAAGPEDALRRATTEAIARAKGGADGTAIALDGSRAAVRVMSLPASAAKQLGDVLAFELEAQIPFDMEESIFDWRVLSPDPASPEALRVLAAVARVEDVRARIDLVKTTLGLEPERVGVGAFPLANLAPHVGLLAEPGPMVVLDLGNRSSEVLVLKDGEPAFARTISYGTHGLPGTAGALAREVRLSLAAYRAQGGPPPTKVVLCGGGAFVSGAERFLENDLQLPVQTMPAPTLDLAELDPARVPELPRFAKAIGIALGMVRSVGLNLRRGPLAYERGYAWVRDKVPLVAGLAAVILVSFVFSAWAKLHALTSEREALEGALATVTKDVLGEETSTASRAEELLQQHTAINDDDPMPHGDAFDVMVKISQAIPQSMKHDIEELDVQKGHVVVHGIVPSIPDAQSIAQSLSSEACFKDVKITRTAQQPGGERQKYVMEFDMKCPEDVKSAPKKKGESGASSAAASASGGK